jgi:hypothetical protein
MNTRHLQSMGIPGLIGFGLILFCASFYFGTIAPMETQMDFLNTEAQKLTETLRRGEPIAVSAIRTESETSSAAIKPAAEPLEIVRGLNAAAETSAVMIERASYTIAEKEGVRRIEVSLPTKGGYLSIRNYLREALTVGRGAQIETLVLQRARAADPTLDADLKLSFELDAR